MTTSLPRATTSLSTTAGAPASGTDLIAVIAPVASNADSSPRLMTSTQAILDRHGYAPGVDYCALHFEGTRKPVLFVGVPIATQGTVGRTDSSGNTGTSTPSVAAGGDGALEETDGVATVTTGGTIGTDQIVLGLSLDGGRTTKTVRLGTATSYAIPHVGLTLSFGAGTLVAGDTCYTWHTSAPRWNTAGLTAARTALAGQSRLVRTFLIEGDLTALADATDINTQVSAYETTDERFVVARAQLRDRLPYATMSKVQVRMTGSPNLTFAEVGATGDTITRSAGSWTADGFAVGDIITISGSASNDMTITAPLAGVTATVLTLDTDDLTDEGPVGGVTVTGTPALTFTEVGATGDTLVRNRGSWLDDGFRVGDLVVITDTVSNNITAVAGIATLTATTMTFGTTDLVDEVIGSYGVTITAGETKAAHLSTMDSTFASVTAMRRINLGHGRARKLSPILGYRMRRPVQWGASIREYQHDVHITTWRKDLGALDGWDLNDANGNLYEHDDRVDGGASAARFTSFRTWANGPAGTFIARDLTRETESSILKEHHNMAVANVACAITQAHTENFIGATPTLNADGTAETSELEALAARVNTELAKALLANVRGEGRRASSAKYKPNTDDLLNVAEATLNGNVELNLRGTIVNVATTVRAK